MIDVLSFEGKFSLYEAFEGLMLLLITVGYNLVFKRVRKISKKRLLGSSSLAVCPHGTTPLPLDGYS